MLNHIVIMGRLTRDPELRRTGSGIPVASFSIACERDFSGKDGGEKETDFIDVVAWRNTAEFVSNYFTKGRMIICSGRLQIRGWTDKDGNKRRTAEVVADSCYFGDSKPDGQSGQDGGKKAGIGQYMTQGQGGYQPAGQGYQPSSYQGPQQFAAPPYPGNAGQAQPKQNYPQYQQQGFRGYGQPVMANTNGYEILTEEDAQLPF